MANKIIKAQMKQRRDTKANWAAQNPVLLAGELGIVSDDPNLYKVGDGTTAWNALPFRGFDGTLAQETGTSETAVMSQKAISEKFIKQTEQIEDNQQKTSLVEDYLKISCVFPNIKGYVNTSGDIIDDPGAFRTDYINTEGFAKIKGTGGFYATGYILAFFDKDKRFIAAGSLKGNSANRLVEFETDIPSLANFAIISNYGTENQSQSYAVVLNENNLNDVALKSQKAIEGETYLLTKGNYVGSDGTIMQDSNAYSTDFIDVESMLKISARGSFYATGYIVAFFDKDKNFIKEGSVKGEHTNSLQNIEAAIPFGAKYAVVSTYGSTNYAESFLKTQGLKSALKKDVTKKVLIFGDSITETKNITYNNTEEPYTLAYAYANSNWVDYFQKQQNAYVQFSEVRNYAKSGARFIKVSSGQDARQFIGFQIDEALADLNAPAEGYFYGKDFQPDIIVVSMGTNDYETASSTSYDDAMNKSVFNGNQIDIDATIEALKNTVFAESVRKHFMRLKKAFPYAKMYMCLPLQRKNIEFPSGILECLRKMSARYGFTVIDCYGESGITRDFHEVYLADGLHPNATGKELMGKFIINRILADNLY